MTQIRKWSILTAVAVVIVLIAGYTFFVKPQKSKSADLKSQASSQVSQNQILQSQIAQLQAEERTLPQQQAALRKFTTQVPDNAAEPTIIRQLSAAANGSGVDLISMTPGTATDESAAASTATTLNGSTAAASGLYVMPISLGVTGSFPNMESFFQSLETLPRAMMITSWCLAPIAATGSTAATSSGPSAGATSCSTPAVPGNKTVPANTLGGSLSANIFYSPPDASTAPSTGTAATGTTTTPSTATTSAPTTGTTPAPTTSTPAATTGGTTPPAS